MVGLWTLSCTPGWIWIQTAEILMGQIQYGACGGSSISSSNMGHKPTLPAVPAPLCTLPPVICTRTARLPSVLVTLLPFDPSPTTAYPVMAPAMVLAHPPALALGWSQSGWGYCCCCLAGWGPGLPCAPCPRLQGARARDVTEGKQQDWGGRRGSRAAQVAGGKRHGGGSTRTMALTLTLSPGWSQTCRSCLCPSYHTGFVIKSQMRTFFSPMLNGKGGPLILDSSNLVVQILGLDPKQLPKLFPDKPTIS